MTIDPQSPFQTDGSSSGDWLIGGGEMGKVVRSMDWSETPLGPIDSWPPSLRTTVSLALNSNFPISLAWGPQHTQIYNDGYWPICGDKHPQAMGQDFSQCWASAWPAIGEAFTSALAGTAAFLEDQRMFLDRRGYLEETFFTFSFSPIRDAHGQVVGLFHPVTETTSKMVGQRRTRTLRDLGTHGLSAQSLDGGLQLAAQTLTEASFDLPFVLFYTLNKDGQMAQLAAQTGLAPGTIASPATVDLTQTGGWPLMQVATNGTTLQLDDLRQRFSDLDCGPYPEPITSAFVHAITPPGHEGPACIMIAGVSTRLPINESYAAFYDLLAAAVTTMIANAIAHATERQRTEALAEIDRAKTVFFSNVSHEFRTPLTLLLGPLEDELAEQVDALPAARRERLETAHRNSLRLLKLVNTLLDFARIESGRLQAVYAPTDLASLTIDLASNFRAACERAGLHLIVDCPPLPVLVYVDHDMWEKIVLNLLSNAFKFTLTGAITVTLTQANEAVELVVRDTGVGIPADELPQILERFYRVKGAQSRTHEGTGIGLALVQGLITLHGGELHVASILGQGSTFTVTIPFGTNHLPANRLDADLIQESTALGASPFVEEALRWLPGQSAVGSRQSAVGSRARIVWADDNADMREYVQRLLSEYYDVEAVADGEEALAAVRRQPTDLLLTDVMMPHRDGFSLLHELRSDERTRAMPIILLSARAAEEAHIEGLNARADDYLVKPFSARELLARVGTQIELAQLRHAWAVDLERRVEERTAALKQTTIDLHIEIGERQQVETALRRSEQHYRLLFDTMLQGLVYQDRSGQIISMNPAAERILGRTPDSFLGHTSEDLAHATLREDGSLFPGLEHPAMVALRTGHAVPNVVMQMYNPREQAYRWLNINAVPLFEPGQAQPYQVYSIFEDITDRKRVEQALQASEERFAKAFRANPTAMSITRMHDGCFIDINVSHERLFGYQRTDLIGQHAGAIRMYANSAQRAEVVQIMREQGSLRETELTLRTKSGEIREVLCSLETIALDGEACILGSVFDITDRKRAQQALRASEERLRVLADASRTFVEVGLEYQVLLDTIVQTTTRDLCEGCTISLLSDDGVRLHVAALYDVDPEKLALQRVMLVNAPQRTDELLGKQIIQSQQPILIPSIDHDHAGATMKPELWSLLGRLGTRSMLGVPMRARGQTIGILSLFRHRPDQPPFDAGDLTLAQDLADRAALAIGNARLLLQVQHELAERMQVEDQIRQLNAELEQRVADRTTDLMAANRELESFSYSVSHDLRAPLRAINGFARIVFEDYGAELPDDAKRYFDLIRTNAQQMGHLIDDLLAFSRLGRQSLNTRSVASVELVQQCLEELRDEQVGRRIEITIGELGTCTADPALLKQVWINLIANALKYTRRRDPAEIEIGYRTTSGETIYFIKDNGVGFDMNYRDKLFGVFQRLHRAEEYEGTGVGLAIVQRIIQRHGGRIWAEAVVDQGATFCFTLAGELL